MTILHRLYVLAFALIAACSFGLNAKAAEMKSHEGEPWSVYGPDAYNNQVLFKASNFYYCV
jgi:hypothetical protein